MLGKHNLIVDMVVDPERWQLDMSLIMLHHNRRSEVPFHEYHSSLWTLSVSLKEGLNFVLEC